MERRMEPVDVWTRDGAIFLAQDKAGDRNGVVKLSADQVPVVVEWLQAARAELSSDKQES